ncbi:DUF2723 domain-containing protein [Candidatus Daviesbacteria bacterium]|nr:DUF2723 domain-containing protein [Candidatus Daviesbacteria bacterium]
MPLSLLILAFLIYFYTKPPSILWIDSGTMIAAASSLGIPNPPGFPFYMMASHIFTQVTPFFTKLLSLELFTIIFSLALLLMVYKIILLILQNNFFFHKPARNATYSASGGLPHLSALFGATALAFSYQYWSQSQNTEAFIFTYFFVALFAYLLLKIMVKKREITEKKLSFNRYSAYLFKILLLVAFLYGLAAGANPTVASLVPATLYVMFLNRKSLNIPKLIILGLIFAATISAVYSYLPIRASSWPFINWGNPQTWKLFIGHLHGEGLNIYEPEGGSINGFTGSPLIFAQSFSYFLLNTLIQFTPFLFPFMALGIYYVYKVNRFLLVFLLSVPVIDVVYSGIYYSGNQESWFILAWEFLSIFLGAGFYFAALKFKLSGRKLFLVFSLCFLPLLSFFWILDRSNHYFASDYAYNLYSPLEKNAIIIGTGDFFNSLSHYLHEADIYRPDVTPLTANVFYVNRWERDVVRHATNLSVSDKIEQIIQYKKYSEYNDAMNQFIDENINSHPIYVTHLTLRASALAATDGGQLRLDEKRFKFVPNGLTLKVIRATQEAKLNLALYDFKFTTPLHPKPYYLERNYRGGFNNILNDYVYAYEYLGDYFAKQGDNGQALKYFNMAKATNPENAEVLAHLGEFYARMRDFNSSYHYLAKAERLDVKNLSVHFNLGLSYINIGRTDQAKLEFETVKQLSPIGDPIGLEADNILKKISTYNLNDPANLEQTVSWKEIQDPGNHFSIKIPPKFSVSKDPNAQIMLISDNNPGSMGLNIQALATKLKEGENIEDHISKSPLKMTGVLLDVQPINFIGFIAAVQVFGTPQGDSSQRFVLIKESEVWQFKVYPGNSIKLDLFYKMLGTFKPL